MFVRGKNCPMPSQHRSEGEQGEMNDLSLVARLLLLLLFVLRCGRVVDESSGMNFTFIGAAVEPVRLM